MDIVTLLQVLLLLVVIGFPLTVLVLVTLRNKLRLHFVVVDAKTKAPRPGLTVYGVATVATTTWARTQSGDTVSIQNGGSSSHKKKLGVTDENGEFRGEYLFAGYGMITFDVMNEYGTPNLLLCQHLRLEGASSPKKVIEVSPKGTMQIDNPNEPEQVRFE